MFEEGEKVEGVEVCGERVECVRKVKRWKGWRCVGRGGVCEEEWRCVRVKRWRGDRERYVEGAWEGVEL